MTLAGHSLAHFPQPTHFSCRTWAVMPRTTSMACSGQTFTQQPQATQADGSTTALRRYFTEFIQCYPQNQVGPLYRRSMRRTVMRSRRRQMPRTEG